MIVPWKGCPRSACLRFFRFVPSRMETSILCSFAFCDAMGSKEVFSPGSQVVPTSLR